MKFRLARQTDLFQWSDRWMALAFRPMHSSRQSSVLASVIYGHAKSRA